MVAGPPPVWDNPVRGLFSISVASDLSGLHPQTLRTYEREGLLDPERSSGGTRRYSTHDIDRLRAISALTAAGLNLAGVRRVLELEEEIRRLVAEVARLKMASMRRGSNLTGERRGRRDEVR